MPPLPISGSGQRLRAGEFLASGLSCDPHGNNLIVSRKSTSLDCTSAVCAETSRETKTSTPMNCRWAGLPGWVPFRQVKTDTHTKQYVRIR